MIDIEFTDENGVLGVTLTGHADKAPKGEDIYCSAASILAYTLAQNVTDARLGLKGRPKIRLEEGDCVIKCRPKDKFREQIKAKFDVILAGYRLMAHNFPEVVRFNDITPQG